MPGMDATGSVRWVPSRTNTGWIRSLGVNTVSRMRRRENSSRRMRRGRECEEIFPNRLSCRDSRTRADGLNAIPKTGPVAGPPGLVSLLALLGFRFHLGGLLHNLGWFLHRFYRLLPGTGLAFAVCLSLAFAAAFATALAAALAFAAARSRAAYGIDATHHRRQRPNLGLDDVAHGFEDRAHRAHALHGAQLALGLVIGHQRRGLRLVHLQTLADGLCVVVRAVRQRGAALLTLVAGLRRRKVDVVDRAAVGLRAVTPAGEALHEHVFLDVHEQRRLQRLTGRASMASSACACGMLRGKPSRMNPPLASGLARRL